jgi:hypothetical protein
MAIALYYLVLCCNTLFDLYLLSLQTVYFGLEPFLHQIFKYFLG